MNFEKPASYCSFSVSKAGLRAKCPVEKLSGRTLSLKPDLGLLLIRVLWIDSRYMDEIHTKINLEF